MFNIFNFQRANAHETNFNSEMTGIKYDPTYITMHLYEMALNEVVNIIGNCLSQMQVDVYSNGKRIKSALYYQFNLQPNINQNASIFYMKLAHKLVNDNEALIIQSENGINLIIAENFEINKSNFKEYVYHNIELDNNLKMNRAYKASEVIHIKLNNHSVKKVFDNLYNVYGELLGKLINNFHKKRGFFDLANVGTQKEEDQSKLKALLETKVRDFYSEKDVAVMVREKGISFNDASKNEIQLDDISNLIEKIYDEVFSAFNIDINLFKNKNTSQKSSSSNSTEKLIMFCINPIALQFEREVNYKIMGVHKNNKNYIKVNFNKLKNQSLIDSANAIDIMRRNGFTHNEILHELGKEEIDSDWANKRYMTKNYECLD